MPALHRLLTVLGLFGLCEVATAQSSVASYPHKPIRLVVPFPPGAGTDAVARLVAAKLAETMKATIVIDNRVGAGGAIGAEMVAKADADGYTLLFVASPFTTVPASTKTPTYDPVNDFAPVAPIAVGPLAFVIHPGLPVSSMRELIAFSKARLGTLNYGSAGTGSVNHLALELLKRRTGVDLTHVPYKGIAPAMLDLLSGQIQAMTASIPATLPYAAQNKIRVLAVTGPKRSKLLPDVPTWKEGGIDDAAVINYWGIVAPANTPRDIILFLNAEMRKTLAQDDLRERLEKEGAEIVSDAPERLGTLIRSDLSHWKRLIAESGISIE